MPRVRIVLFKDRSAGVPMLEWLRGLPLESQAECRALLEVLSGTGYELWRPWAAYLGDGLYELRSKEPRVNHRMLYFFHQRWTAVLTHGFAKQAGAVFEREIQLALRRKHAFEADPEVHTHREEIGP